MDKNKDEQISDSVKKTNKSVKKVLNPFEKLEKRILKQFESKKLIGDILISDKEYEILIDYFKSRFNWIKNSDTHIINDPIFAVALVQIGIRCYDGNFWGHVAEILGVERLNSNYQKWIGESFIYTLSLNNKIIIDNGEKVENILLHGFVSDKYASDMFDFLFKYYNIDLERDLHRNNSEMMNNLIDIILKNDNTGRTYLLVKQTSDAIRANIRGGKIRIRRLLRLIDRCFWEQIAPTNPVSRLSVLFNSWQENSLDFKLQYNKFNRNYISERSRKNFSSPYLKCDFINTRFKIVLPPQLIKFQYKDDVKWKIISKEQPIVIETYLYEAITGYKTEEKELDISSQDIFSEFLIELNCGDKPIRLFKIKSDCIRFFDKYGDCLNGNNLPKGEVYAFTRENEIPISQALIENETIGNLVRSYFEFEYGDIVRLPDGKPLSIGKKLEEGLLHRNALNNAYATYNNENMPIYCAPPSVLLKIDAKRSIGTAIDVNEKRYHMFDNETTVIDLNDRSGETGYIINLKDYGCIQDGIYSVFVDVPNDRTNRIWQFVLINNLKFRFEDAPYIFETKGTICFNEELKVQPIGTNVEKNNDENSYNFLILPDMENIEFEFNTKHETINLIFDIPVFKWKFEGGSWNIEKPSDIWYSDFPSTVYIKYTEDKIRLSLDEQIGNEDELEDQSVVYYKSKAKGIFECDTTRFKSWFGREKVVRIIFIDFPGKRIEFARVITKSVIASYILKDDCKSQKLIGEFDIIGNACYYADVTLVETKSVLAEKLPIIDGKFIIEGELGSGQYKISIYEDDEDDTGFGTANYLLLKEFVHKVINPYNLEGQSIVINYIISREDTLFRKKPKCEYIIRNLKRMNESDKNCYSGKLMVKTLDVNNHVAFDVNVEFFDLNKLQYMYLTYFDGYDNVAFLYDSEKNIIVKDEDKGLKSSVKYRRYESLFPEDYIYVVEFIDDISFNGEEAAIDINKSENNKLSWKDESVQRDVSESKELIAATEDIKFTEKDIIEVQHGKNIAISRKSELQKYEDILDTPISEIGLSMMVYNCLKKAKISTIRGIVEKGEKLLGSVRGYNKKMYKETMDRLHAIGISIK